MMLDLHKVRKDRRDRLPRTTQQCNAHVQGEFLVNKDMSRMADQQIHRVIHRSSARILNRHNPEIFREANIRSKMASIVGQDASMARLPNLLRARMWENVPSGPR